MDKVTRTMKNAGIVMALSATGAIKMVPNDFGNGVKNSVISTVSNDIVNYVETRRSDILEMNYKNLLDKFVFSTAFFTGIEYTNVDGILTDTLKNLKIPPLLIKPAVVASLITATELLRLAVDETPPLRDNMLISAIAHPSNLLF